MDTSVAQNIVNGKYKNNVPYTKDTRAAYGAEEGRLLKLFWDDVREEFDLDPNNSKHERMLSIAWDRGHSSGLHEVLYHVEELAELVK